MTADPLAQMSRAFDLVEAAVMARNPDSTAEDIAERQADLEMQEIQRQWKDGVLDEEVADALLDLDSEEEHLDGEDCHDILQSLYRARFKDPRGYLFSGKDAARRSVAVAVRERVDLCELLYLRDRRHPSWAAPFEHLHDWKAAFLAAKLEAAMEGRDAT